MEARSRTVPLLPAGITVVIGALLLGAYQQGAYHQTQHQLFAVLVGVGGLLLLAESQVRSALPRVLVIAAPLVGSTVVSTALSDDRSDAGSTFLLLALLVVGLLAGIATPAPRRDTVLWAIVAVAVLVAATAIWGVAAQSSPWGRVTEGVWRGSSSLTYSNAAAAIIGPVSLITFIKAAREDHRGLAVATVFLTVGFTSTQSRGGALALLIVLPFVVGHLGLRRFALAALPVGVGVAIGVPLLLARASTTTTAVPVLVSALIAIGLAATAGLWSIRSRIPRPEVSLLAISVAAVGAIALSPLGDRLTQRLTLRSGTTAGGEDAGVLFGDRAQEWTVAWAEFREQPLFGHGPGVVDLAWVEDGTGFRAMFVHNEYLELAVTHGIVGLLALLATAGLLGRHLRRSEHTVPLAIAIGMFLLHSTVDFLWHLPLLPVLFAAVIGLWMNYSTQEHPGPVIAESQADSMDQPAHSL